MRGSAVLIVGIAAAGVAGASCGGSPSAVEHATVARLVRSNALRGDYAGSRACASCHAAIYQAWSRSPMRKMTREAASADVRATFDGATVRVMGDAVTVEQRDGVRFMRVQTEGQADKLYRVTRVLGGNHREDFVGVDVTGALDPSSDAGDGPELVLPASYVFSTKSWRYKGYSVMSEERRRIAVGPVWSRACIGCHNTLPRLTMQLDDLAGPKAPSFQGSITENLLPPSRAAVTRVRDADALQEALQTETTFLGVAGHAVSRMDLPDALVRTIRVTRQRFDGAALVETGVGCEACHNGAREHVEDPKVMPTFDVRGDAFFTEPAAGGAFSDASVQNRVCGRCHTVLFSQYRYTWEGGVVGTTSAGGSSINSGEARDFLLGGCASALTCTTCHDPHAADAPGALARFDTPEGNAVCTKCHASYADAGPLAAHTHHDASSAGSACASCHMPKKNLGLSYALTRYHRIGSPTDEARVYEDRPLECVLCHAGMSTEQALSKMESWYGKRFDRERVKRLYGADLSASNLDATVLRGRPHEQATAVAALGDRGDAEDACTIATQLTNPYPLVRYFARHALERVGSSLAAIDPGAAAETIAPEVRARCVKAKLAAPAPPSTAPEADGD